MNFPDFLILIPLFGMTLIVSCHDADGDKRALEPEQKEPYYLESFLEAPEEDKVPENVYLSDGMYLDGIETDPRHKEIFARINQEVNELLADDPSKGMMGFVHVFWERKQKLLLDKYHIQWRSPAELNPMISFD